MNEDRMRPRRRMLGLAAALCGAIGLVSLSTQAARADGDGLKMQRDYEMRQADCARRWRDQASNPSINMIGCMGFNQGMPAAANAALAADAKRGTAAAPAVPYGQVRQVKLPYYGRNSRQP